MNKLRVSLKKQENPYTHENSSKYDLWGQIILSYNDMILLDTQWNILDFIEWFDNNYEKLDNEVFPFILNNSIAESRDILYDKEDFTNDKEENIYYRDLENYFSSHYFKMKGTNTNAFYIGLRNDIEGEISCKINHKYYSYSFIMNDFVSQARKEIDIFLSSYIDSGEKDIQIILEKRLPNYKIDL